MVGPVALNDMHDTERAGKITLLLLKRIITFLHLICCSGYDIVTPEEQNDVPRSPSAVTTKESGGTI